MGYFYALGSAIIWGLVYVIDQKILATVNPILLVAFNSIITLIVLVPLILIGQPHFKFTSLDKSSITYIMIAGLLTVVANIFIFSAIKHLNAPTASIIEIAYPLFVVLFSYIIFKASPNLYFLLGGTLIFAGTIIIIKLA